MDNRDTSGNASYPTLKATMEDSCFAIVVLSGKYADSTRSLDELAMICECMNTGQDRIFPVFDQVEPAGYHGVLLKLWSLLLLMDRFPLTPTLPFLLQAEDLDI